MHVITAKRADHFVKNGMPVMVVKIVGDRAEQHNIDLTDIPHRHDFSELVFIASGSGVHAYGRHACSVSPGDVFLLRGRKYHYFPERHNIVMYNIMFDPAILGREARRVLRGLPGGDFFFTRRQTERAIRHEMQAYRPISMSEQDLSFSVHRNTAMPFVHVADPVRARLEAILEAMMSEIHSGAPGSTCIAAGRVLEIFVLLAREYAALTLPNPRFVARLQHVLATLEKHCTRKWTLAEIAKLAGMASSTLMPIFRNATGVSPIDYVIRARLRNACTLLTQTDLSISDISDEVGFRDSNYFSRQFHRVYLVSPRHFRTNSF